MSIYSEAIERLSILEAQYQEALKITDTAPSESAEHAHATNFVINIETASQTFIENTTNAAEWYDKWQIQHKLAQRYAEHPEREFEDKLDAIKKIASKVGDTDSVDDVAILEARVFVESIADGIEHQLTVQNLGDPTLETPAGTRFEKFREDFQILGDHIEDAIFELEIDADLWSDGLNGVKQNYASVSRDPLISAELHRQNAILINNGLEPMDKFPPETILALFQANIEKQLLEAKQDLITWKERNTLLDGIENYVTMKTHMSTQEIEVNINSVKKAYANPIDREIDKAHQILRDDNANASEIQDAKDYLQAVKNGTAHYLTVIGHDYDTNIETETGDAFQKYCDDKDQEIEFLGVRALDLEEANDVDGVRQMHQMIGIESQKLNSLERIEDFARQKYEELNALSDAKIAIQVKSERRR